ncbi:glycosyltransferase [Aminipila terrae]|uniref:Glycosyltransferase n=1 Tax=Aminipila terrae TaxID=2697030 RepID=A0A6P1MCE9_9FIRM|nr:glycosyltransferase [Aminipila terrae]QHI72320.1 glycosyltransferase [Aminipila terrae]
MLTIVYPATIDYEWMYQRPQQLLKAFAELGNRVVFYNYDYFYKQQEPVIELYPNFFVCRAEVPLKDIGVEGPVVLWITYPMHVQYVGKFNEDLVVFDALDEPAGEFEYWAKDVNELSSKSDIIFTTAKKLYDYHTQRHDNVHMCPNAADYDHFSKAQKVFAQKPLDFPKNNRPTIGYYGALATWVDWDLIRYISNQNRHFNFVMIGPLYDKFRNPVKANNIYYLGRKDYWQLPEYLQWLDVCMIPFKVTPMIEGCNPIKMYEYLSAGKAVITTDMPETSQYSQIYVGRTKEEFNQKMRIALLDKENEERKNERILLAKNNSWHHRAEKALEEMEKALKNKEGK